MKACTFEFTFSPKHSEDLPGKHLLSFLDQVSGPFCDSLGG